MPWPCHDPAVPCRANSHMPCCAAAILKQCRVLRETPRGSRKKPSLGRAPTDRREKANVNSHMPRHAPAVLCLSLEKSLAKHGRGMTWYV